MRNKRLYFLAVLLSLSGCSLLISPALEELGSNLQQVMLDSDDPDTVTEAIPAYLLLQEAILASDPENVALLASTARLYAAYAALLTDQDADRIERTERLSNKALQLASRAACLHRDKLCGLQTLTYADFSDVIDETDADDLESLYVLGTAWAGWIMAHKSDWNAIAQLAQVKLIMSHIVALDESYRSGEVYLYLGLLESILPAALGGKPDLAKAYFDKARAMTGDKNLMVLVFYAQHYARMMFDRALHDRLLKRVMTANPQQKGLTLINTLAQQRAAELLQSADDYF